VSDLRSDIINEIKRVAAETGQPPGWQLFRTSTAFKESDWRGRFWSKWGDALAEAGFSPNQWVAKLDSDQILRAVADLSRKLGHVPTFSELMLLRRNDSSIPSSRTVLNHFKKDALVANLWHLAETEPQYADLVDLLPTAAETGQAAVSRQDGWVYLLKSGSHHKIGRSDTLERRVRVVGVAMPDATVLDHAIRTDDPAGIEAYWHRRFAEKRVGGEWFKLSRADVAAFKRRKSQ
jgi:hypothetical protein